MDTPEKRYSYDAIKTLLNMLDYSGAVGERTNQELHDILVEHVCAELDIDTAAYALVSEVADRLLHLDAKDALIEELERMISLETRQAIEIGSLKGRCLEPVPASLEFDLVTYAIRVGKLPDEYQIGRRPIKREEGAGS